MTTSEPLVTEVEVPISGEATPLHALLHLPSTPVVAGVALVPDSRHERDVYLTVADDLVRRGVCALRIDIRGRGASRGTKAYSDMGPMERRLVSRDVGACLDHLVAEAGVAADRLGLVAERDTAPDAVAGAVGRARVMALLAARAASRLTHALRQRPTPVLGVVSADDRDGVRGTVDAYLASSPLGSRLVVLHRRGFGATMLSTAPGPEGPLEALIGGWLAEQLA